MDEEKMQRHMDFLLEWQTQFAAELGELKESTMRNSENITRLEGVVERVVGVIERLAQVTAERSEETDRKIAALVDSQIQTEESLRNLSATLDRHIADGHGGRGKQEG